MRFSFYIAGGTYVWYDISMEGDGSMERKINVQGNEINLLNSNSTEDYICITDMARYKNPERTGFVIQNWMRNRNTSNSWVFGNNSITQILNTSNSMPLEWLPDSTVSY